LEEIGKLGSAKKIYIGGFAEGGSIALQTYMKFNKGILGGVVCCGGSYLG
jgi:predicted esterase